MSGLVKSTCVSVGAFPERTNIWDYNKGERPFLNVGSTLQWAGSLTGTWAWLIRLSWLVNTSQESTLSLSTSIACTTMCSFLHAFQKSDLSPYTCMVSTSLNEPSPQPQPCLVWAWARNSHRKVLKGPSKVIDASVCKEMSPAEAVCPMEMETMCQVNAQLYGQHIMTWLCPTGTNPSPILRHLPCFSPIQSFSFWNTIRKILWTGDREHLLTNT